MNKEKKLQTMKDNGLNELSDSELGEVSGGGTLRVKPIMEFTDQNLELYEQLLPLGSETQLPTAKRIGLGTMPAATQRETKIEMPGLE